MSDNVLILGAGFSCDAGIPLLGSFVERMWDIAERGSYAGKGLTESDSRLLGAARAIGKELDGYHGRANFNDRNIEDILSILSCNVLGGDEGERNKLKTFTLAIARTIELTCTVTHPGVPPSSTEPQQREVVTGPPTYRSFWKALIKWKAQGHELPTIITFNYDLVLERSLLQVLVGTQKILDGNVPLPMKSLSIDYKYKHVPSLVFGVQGADFLSAKSDLDFVPGRVLVPLDKPLADTMTVEILKLHGSVNFPTSSSLLPLYNVAAHIADPHMLPPISNKYVGDQSHSIWRAALDRIRSAKHITIVGYSLPSTDMYMQYFMRAAVGPNYDLRKITVFDPVLCTNGDAGGQMRRRFQDCFAQQLLSRLSFVPALAPASELVQGTTAHFVHELRTKPESILF